MSSFKIIGLWVLEKKISKGYGHILAWWPSLVMLSQMAQVILPTAILAPTASLIILMVPLAAKNNVQGSVDTIGTIWLQMASLVPLRKRGTLPLVNIVINCTIGAVILRMSLR